MNLVKFGSITVNFDRVAAVRDLTSAPGGNGESLVRIEFSGGHTIDVSACAQELLEWVDQNASDVSTTVP